MRTPSLMRIISELSRLDSSEPCREVPSDNPQSIVADLQAAADTSQQESDDEDDNSTIEPPPTTAAVIHAVDTLRRSLYASNADTSMHATFSKVENFLTAMRASRCQQATITGYGRNSVSCALSLFFSFFCIIIPDPFFL